LSELTEKLTAIKQITRMDKPIGTYLLLWPTYWALWIASDGWPTLHMLFVFTLGVFLMRSAGCVINDFADRKIDGAVKRTQNRPLVTGALSSSEALQLFATFILFSLGLVLTLSNYTIMLSFVAVLLAASYPFMKRITHFPQVVLGAAFSWGMIMVFAQEQGQIPVVAWLLFTANVLWTVAYDTFYAMCDREDDLKIGVKSTAILFGSADRLITFGLQMLIVAGLVWVGLLVGFGWIYWLALGGAALLLLHQQWLIREREPQACLAAFLNNHWFGAVVFAGILFDYLLR
jgi:4-hydroxybenzoate polyprenyltransferase